MNNQFIIYGPPASGESTLLKTLPTLMDGCTVVDLELVDTKEERLALIQCLAEVRFKGPLFAGAADLAPREFPESFQVVSLLHKEKAQYLATGARRNESNSDKKGQDEDRLFDCFTRVSANNKQWIHIDPESFEGECTKMAEDLLAKTGLPSQR